MTNRNDRDFEVNERYVSTKVVVGGMKGSKDCLQEANATNFKRASKEQLPAGP